MSQTRIAVVLMFLFSLGQAALCEARDPSSGMKFPPLGEISVPKIEPITLENGMQVYLLEDHELPLIDVSALIRTGSIYEPADKVGLASIAGTVMRTGGTRSLPGDSLDQILEGMAASIETSIGQTSGSATMSVMKEDFDVVLSLFADVLMNPAFPEGKIQLAKLQMRSEISRRNDDPNAISRREFAKLIYGAGHPYARQVEYRTIAAVSREDLIEFHRAYFRPNSVMMAIWGDFDSAQMKEKITRAFGAWKSAETQFPAVADVDTAGRGSVNYVFKEDVNQTTIRMGHVGIRADDPYYYPLLVLNEILGGGMGSRLFSGVRSSMGLAYWVGSSPGDDFHHKGIFRMVCGTKSESTGAAIEALIAELRRITTEEVTDEELKMAKNNLLNSFVFNFDTKGKMVTQQVFYRFYGYPSDFLEKYRRGVELVTRGDVLNAARARLHPDRLTILAVGRGQDFDRPLSTFGEVRTIDVAIPAEEGQ